MTLITIRQRVRQHFLSHSTQLNTYIDVYQLVKVLLLNYTIKMQRRKFMFGKTFLLELYEVDIDVMWLAMESMLSVWSHLELVG